MPQTKSEAIYDLLSDASKGSPRFTMTGYRRVLRACITLRLDDDAIASTMRFLEYDRWLARQRTDGLDRVSHRPK